jgi:hypothetical protein
MLTLEIRRALARPEVSMAQLVSLISRDPALSALLMKYASSALLRTRLAPKTLQDVLRVLGMQQVDRVVMLHSVKSLFVLHSPGHTLLFMDAWQRLILKASICGFLARKVGQVAADHAALAGLLSEVGSLAVLSAFKDGDLVPTPARYHSLCQAYSQSLGVRGAHREERREPPLGGRRARVRGPADALRRRRLGAAVGRAGPVLPRRRRTGRTDPGRAPRGRHRLRGLPGGGRLRGHHLPGS